MNPYFHFRLIFLFLLTWVNSIHGVRGFLPNATPPIISVPNSPYPKDWIQLGVDTQARNYTITILEGIPTTQSGFYLPLKIAKFVGHFPIKLVPDFMYFNPYLGSIYFAIQRESPIDFYLLLMKSLRAPFPQKFLLTFQRPIFPFFFQVCIYLKPNTNISNGPNRNAITRPTTTLPNRPQHHSNFTQSHPGRYRTSTTIASTLSSKPNYWKKSTKPSNPHTTELTTIPTTTKSIKIKPTKASGTGSSGNLVRNTTRWPTGPPGSVPFTKLTTRAPILGETLTSNPTTVKATTLKAATTGITTTTKITSTKPSSSTKSTSTKASLTTFNPITSTKKPKISTASNLRSTHGGIPEKTTKSIGNSQDLRLTTSQRPSSSPTSKLMSTSTRSADTKTPSSHTNLSTDGPSAHTPDINPEIPKEKAITNVGIWFLIGIFGFILLLCLLYIIWAIRDCMRDVKSKSVLNPIGGKPTSAISATSSEEFLHPNSPASVNEDLRIEEPEEPTSNIQDEEYPRVLDESDVEVEQIHETEPNTEQPK